ncbi:hypothetical protein GCM10010218_13850 [Streptomyces mashuensis]|uniref:Uncharacterized protein n=1 Tax=Streptomyces mashuensis TaxID=33904 RepID=A0A919EBJ1_9ACTN|nr:hypothetical protein [Streptomyces mashuensis]GHF33938.1 hypothetical protein GCM10010218_13850 [Streptomyces mashuensis]
MVAIPSPPTPAPSDADLRRISAQTAHELQAVCREHGWALHITAGEPMSGNGYVEFPPLRVDVAQQIIAGLRRLLTTRCEECQAIKRRRAQALREKDTPTARAMAVAMGRHLRAAH